MRDDLIASFLKAVGSYQTGKSEKVITGPCPLAPFTHSKGTDKSPSFGIFRGPGAKCHCFSCDASGDLFKLIIRLKQFEKETPSGRELKLGDALSLLDDQTEGEPLIPDDGVPTVADNAFLPPVDMVLPWPESYLTHFEDAYTEHAVHPYLASRAITCTTARRLDLRWDANDARVCFPIRDFHGRLCGLHGRAVADDQEPKYRVYRHQKHANTTVWLGEHWLDFDKSVVVVESVFDLARVFPVYSNILTPRMGGITTEMLKRLDGVNHLVTLSDNDKVGDTFRLKMETLKGALVEHATIAPYKDPGEAPEPYILQALRKYVDIDKQSVAPSIPF